MYIILRKTLQVSTYLVSSKDEYCVLTLLTAGSSAGPADESLVQRVRSTKNTAILGPVTLATAAAASHHHTPAQSADRGETTVKSDPGSCNINIVSPAVWRFYVSLACLLATSFELKNISVDGWKYLWSAQNVKLTVVATSKRVQV